MNGDVPYNRMRVVSVFFCFFFSCILDKSHDNAHDV